jgi:hypothetical protein
MNNFIESHNRKKCAKKRKGGDAYDQQNGIWLRKLEPIRYANRADYCEQPNCAGAKDSLHQFVST